MELPDILNAPTEELEGWLGDASDAADVTAERWCREARAELVRRRWTRVDRS